MTIPRSASRKVLAGWGGIKDVQWSTLQERDCLREDGTVLYRCYFSG